MVEPDVETMPWGEQRRLDDAGYRKQVEYLLASSRFYQVKLRDAGFSTPEKIGGLDRIAALPFTEKSEIRASCSEADPMGTHLAVARDKIVRILLTRGTTGTTSYITLTDR